MKWIKLFLLENLRCIVSPMDLITSTGRQSQAMRQLAQILRLGVLVQTNRHQRNRVDLVLQTQWNRPREFANITGTLKLTTQKFNFGVANIAQVLQDGYPVEFQRSAPVAEPHVGPALATDFASVPVRERADDDWRFPRAQHRASLLSFGLIPRRLSDSATTAAGGRCAVRCHVVQRSHR